MLSFFLKNLTVMLVFYALCLPIKAQEVSISCERLNGDQSIVVFNQEQMQLLNPNDPDASIDLSWWTNTSIGWSILIPESEVIISNVLDFSNMELNHTQVGNGYAHAYKLQCFRPL